MPGGIVLPGDGGRAGLHREHLLSGRSLSLLVLPRQLILCLGPGHGLPGQCDLACRVHERLQLRVRYGVHHPPQHLLCGVPGQLVLPLRRHGGRALPAAVQVARRLS